MEPKERKMLGMLTGAHVLDHLIEGTVPPLIPLLMAAFGADYFQMGLVVTVFAYAFGMGAFPAGILVDRVGPQRLLRIFLFGSGLICLAVLPVGNLVSFGIIMGLLGLLGSLYHPAGNTLVSLGMRRRGRVFGINGIAGSLGTAAAPLLAAWLGSRLGWKAPHLVFGSLALLMGLYTLGVPPVSRDEDKPENPGAPDGGRSPLAHLVFFYASCAFAGMGSRGVLTFLPTYLGRSLAVPGGLDQITLGGVAATFTLATGSLGQYISGRLVDKRRPDLLYTGTLFLSSLSVLLLAAGRGPLLVLGAMGYAFFTFGYQPMQNMVVGSLLPPRRHGLGYGLLAFTGFGVGSLAAALAGWLADHRGLSSLFFVMSLCYALAGLMAGGLLVLRGHRLGHPA